MMGVFLELLIKSKSQIVEIINQDQLLIRPYLKNV